MNARSYCVVSALVFAMVAVAHLWRALQSVPVQIGSWQAPMAPSWVAVVVAGGLALWGLRLSARQGP